MNKNLLSRSNIKVLNASLLIDRLISLAPAFLFLAFVVPIAPGQVSLRNALDHDHDGKADATVYRLSNNTWYVGGSSGAITAQNFGASSSDFVVPGDYDGDSIGDIAVWRDTDGTFYYIKSSDSTYNTRAFGQTDDEPVARDYDGDGKTDFAVVRRENGILVWYIQGSTVGFYFSSFGIASDYIAPGDYDGDGRFDLAVYRSAPNNGNSTFYVQRSMLG